MGIFRRLLGSGGGQLEPFIFKITTTSSNKQFLLPVTRPGGTSAPNVNVDWGDSSSSQITSETDPDRFHTYASPGTYTVQVSGYCPGFNVDNNSAYRSLYVEIVDWGTVGFEELNFYGCNNLDTLPVDGSNNAINHQGLNTVKRFSSTFRQTGITSIPNGLFDFASAAISFTNTFVFCQGLTSIPSGLFDNNTEVRDFSSVFRNCRSVVGIPSQFFTNNQKVTTFENAFNMATTSNSLIGVTPTDSNGDEIWERTPTPVGTDCFAFCSGLTNFGDIPLSFK